MFLFAEGAEHTPLIVEFINTYLGKPVHEFEIHYTKPLWDKLLANFGTNAEKLFGEYTVENAIPWYTIMFVIACLLTIALVWIFKGKLSDDAPKNGQLTLEAGYIALRDMIEEIVGSHGMKYFPVVATFAILILISNLMGFFPLFMAPTASVNVTFALGISSFIYYNYVGIRENGVVSHVAHLAGPKMSGALILITPFIFIIELISNFIRPLSLGIRLFGNIFADEQVAGTVSGLSGTLGAHPIFTQLFLPVILMPLALLVCFVQTLVFSLLSMIYLGEVSHAHDEHDHDVEHAEHAEAVHA
jgi:F-type H+-transporting ATPase subunit a